MAGDETVKGMTWLRMILPGISWPGMKWSGDELVRDEIEGMI